MRISDWSSDVCSSDLLKGVYHGLRAAIPIMEAQGHGVIVNISSGAATSALEGWSHYCATKAAVLMLTRCVDKEYRNKGIRVVGLSPGTVATRRLAVHTGGQRVRRRRFFAEDGGKQAPRRPGGVTRRRPPAALLLSRSAERRVGEG